MFKKHFQKVIVFFLLFLVSNVAFAKEQKETKYGIGWQTISCVGGISGMVDVHDNVSVQGILGMHGNLKMCAVRGIYRFKKEPYWNTYGYGMMNGWVYSRTISTIGLAAGIGIEYNWQVWSSNLPPIWWNIELGIDILNFDMIFPSFPIMFVITGVHYRF